MPPHRPGLTHTYFMEPKLMPEVIDEHGMWYDSEALSIVHASMNSDQDLHTNDENMPPPSAVLEQGQRSLTPMLAPMKDTASYNTRRAGAPLTPRNANIASPARKGPSKTHVEVIPNFWTPKQLAERKAAIEAEEAAKKVTEGKQTSLEDYYPLHDPPATASQSKEINTAPQKSTAPAPASNSKKRKIAADEPDVKAIMFPDDVPEIDEDDLDDLDPKKYSCQMVRKKIKTWIESGAQGVGEFQKTVGISSYGYGNFMNRQGTWDGEYCDLYMLAARFFRERELQGLPLAVPNKLKKAKTGGKASSNKQATKKSTDDILDVSGVEIPGESNMTVQVYDTCNEMRKRLRALQTKGVTQAAICRALSTSFPVSSGISVSASNMRSFMNNKGIMGGNTSSVFYGGYVFFEKRRIKEGKPKSKFREEMERQHERGVNVERNMNGPLWLARGETAEVDKYGKLLINGR